MATAAVIAGSAYMSDRASKRAAGATKDAAKTAAQTQMNMFNRMIELQAPWREVGQQALNEMAVMMGLPGITESSMTPTDEWQRWDQQRRLLSKHKDGIVGSLLSKKLGPLGQEPEKFATQPAQRDAGGIMKSLAESPMYQYEQQAMQKAAAARGLLNSGRSIRDEGRLASDHFQRRLAQLGALSGAGSGMAQSMGSMGMNTAGNVSNMQMMAGQAGANRAIEQGNNMANLINQGAQAYAMNNFNQPTGSYAAPQPQYALQNPYAGQDVGLNFDPMGGM